MLTIPVPTRPPLGPESRRPDTSATRRRWFARLWTIVLAFGVALGVGSVGTAQAAAAEPGVTTNCGTVTCSDYISRAGTRQMLDLLNSSDNPAELLSRTACTISGGKRSPVCKVAKLAIKFGEAMTRRTLEDAVFDHPPNGACFKITYLKGSGTTTYISTNNGRHCHDT